VNTIGASVLTAGPQFYDFVFQTGVYQITLFGFGFEFSPNLDGEDGNLPNGRPFINKPLEV
jgi:hypothetical protein